MEFGGDSRKRKRIAGLHPEHFSEDVFHGNPHHIQHRVNTIYWLLCWIIPCLLLAFILGVLGTTGFGLLFGWTECNLHGECNDNDPCTTDTCVNNVCQFNYPTGGCSHSYQCAQTEMCMECMCVETCVLESCTNTTCSVNTCIDGVCQTLKESLPGCCETVSDCVDNGPCTNTTCVNNTCIYLVSTDLPWFYDEDGDGYGPNVEPIYSCEPPVVEKVSLPKSKKSKFTGTAGWVNENGDCNDYDYRIFPGSYTIDQCNLIQRLTIINLTDVLQTWEPVFWVTTAEFTTEEQTTQEVTTEEQTTQEVTTAEVTTEEQTTAPGPLLTSGDDNSEDWSTTSYKKRKYEEHKFNRTSATPNGRRGKTIREYMDMIGAIDVLFDFKVIQVKMGRSFSFATVQAFVVFPGNDTLVTFPVAVVVLQRDPELTGGWYAVQSIVCDADNVDPELSLCNSWGKSLDTIQHYNNTIRVVISQHSGDGNNEYAMAQVWHFNLTNFETTGEPFTKLQDLSTSTVPPLDRSKHRKMRATKKAHKKSGLGLDPTDVPPVMSDVLVSINQDLVAVGRAGGEICAGLIDIYRAPDMLADPALYEFVWTVTPPDDNVCPITTEFTFPTDMALRNQTLFVSAYGYTMHCEAGDLTATGGMIFKYVPDEDDQWYKDEDIYASVPPLSADIYDPPEMYLLGTPHIAVSDNMVLVSSLTVLEVLTELPLPGPDNYNSLVSFEPTLVTGKNIFKYMQPVYNPIQAFYPEFNYVDGKDFGGSANTFEVNTFSLVNNTIIAWSGYGTCNTLHSVTKPGDTWFFGPNLPAPWSLYQDECVDSPMITTNNNVANYRALVSTNLLYNMMEVMAVYSSPTPLPFLEYTVPTNQSLFEVLIFNCDFNTLC